MKIVSYQKKYYTQYVEMMMDQMAFHRTIAEPENFRGYSRKLISDYCDKIITRSEKENADLFIAIENDEPIGFISWYGEEIKSDEVKKYLLKTAIIDEAHITESHRGKGFGEQLFKEVEKIIREKGYEFISLKDVHTNNLAAKKLYEKLGYLPRVIEYAKKLS